MTLLAVADHHTRIAQGQVDGHTRAVGILFGTQTEEAVDVIVTADTLVSLDEGKAGFNLQMTKEQVALSKNIL
jgi:hypothetical protein